MVLNTTKETICVNRIIGQKHDNIVIEGDTIVPDIKPDVLNVIGSSGNVCIYKKEAMDGKIRIDGSINIYVIYMADNENGDIRGLNTILDFTDILDFEGCKSGMSIDDSISVKSIECSVLNGRKLGVKVVLDTNIKVYSNENIEVINEILDMPNLQMLENVLEINSLFNEGSTKVYAKDNISIDNVDDLAEILKVKIKIVNSETKISYNKLVAKAEAEVCIMYLTEDNRISSITKRVPIAGFVDIEGVADSHICNVKYKLKNVIIKPNNVEEHSIYVEAEIEIICYVYERKNIRIIQDLYCPNKVLNFLQNTIETRSFVEKITDTTNVNEKFNIDDGIQIFDTEAKLNINLTKMQNNSVYYDGEIELNYIYGNTNLNQIKSKIIKFPFNYSISLPSMQKMIAETSVNVQDISVMIMPNNSVDLNVKIEFIVETYKDEKMNVIQEINLESENVLDSYSIVVYYTKKGDTLWKIAKMLNSTVDEIKKINNIDDENKIDVGMQLFIPRYVEKMAVSI